MVISYTEKQFQVFVADRYADVFRHLNIPTQIFKLHFSCGKNLTEKQVNFLTDLQEQTVTPDPDCRELVAPCFKIFIPYSEIDEEMLLEEKRLMGYARGTLYLSHFPECDPRQLAEMFIKISQNFPPENLKTMDYSAAFLPYCPGVFLRKSFCTGRREGDYEYVSATQVERSARMIKDGDGDFDKFNQAIKLRAEFRRDQQYLRIQEELHNYFINGLDGVMRITSMKTLFKTTHAAAKQLKSLMQLYKEHGYLASKVISNQLQELAKQSPCVRKGILKISYEHFQMRFSVRWRFMIFV